MELLFPLLILALLVPMFLGIRRQKKEAAQTAALQDSLAVGDRIFTTAGLHATVVGLKDETIELEIAPGVVTTWSRLVVRERIEDAPLPDSGPIEHESIEADSRGDDRGNDDGNTPRLGKD
ncbi:preprotein translocase subunit YajC [Rhodococcus sp. WMMA185]|uniref:preprotein translocase subunit YajC n=1 Tax=Rhodococcus sp. WMMA185 TaxID=679318 RepID=UPI000878A600|nr:preprotein translocase subunit YajC [Rhodococcus sp. WMMA185]AOW92506.1 preprotein translocase subunit YajC [Rhodococcus sp. WMMA185]